MASATPSETLSALLSLVWPRPTARACPRASPTAPSGLPRLRSNQPGGMFHGSTAPDPQGVDVGNFRFPRLCRVALSVLEAFAILPGNLFPLGSSGLPFTPLVVWKCVSVSTCTVSRRFLLRLASGASPRVELFGDVWGLATGFRRQQCLLDLPGSILMPLCEASCWAQAPVVIGQPSVSVGPRAWPSSCVRLCVKAAQGSAVAR